MAASFAFAINYEAILDNTTTAEMKETSFAFNRMRKCSSLYWNCLYFGIFMPLRNIIKYSFTSI